MLRKHLMHCVEIYGFEPIIPQQWRCCKCGGCEKDDATRGPSQRMAAVKTGWHQALLHLRTGVGVFVERTELYLQRPTMVMNVRSNYSR